MKATNDADVLIAGGGPVGLMLACELALAGTRPLVLERRDGIDPTIKAGSINVATVEALYRRDLLPAVRAEQERLPAGLGPGASGPSPFDRRLTPRLTGHFAGIWYRPDRLDPADPDFADRGPAAAGAMIPQQAVEQLLARRAAELGIEVRRGIEVTGFTADGHGVTVTASGHNLHASWLAGCDGGRSLVRRFGGFEFPGTAPQTTGRQALAELGGPDTLERGWHVTGQGLYVSGPASGRILTVEFDGPPADRDAPVTAAELEASLRRVSGADVTVTAVHSATRFTDHARQATSYRRGRVLLAGDAAHVHSPFSGQGLNLGLGDAMNLGWKLAAEVNGWAPGGLLDSYSTERHPLGAWVLDWTRAQTELLRPEAGARALRSVVADLMDTPDGASYVAKRTSGVWQRYDLGGGHPLTGRSAPDLTLADGSRLATWLAGGRGLLLDLADDPGLRAAAAGWTGRVQVITSPCPGRPALAALLVRPDGYVAWAADQGAGAATPTLTDALTRWFGPPTVSPRGHDVTSCPARC